MGPAKFTVMPDIPPIVPMAMIMLATAPTLYTLWKTPNAIIFLKAVTFCSFCRYYLCFKVPSDVPCASHTVSYCVNETHCSHTLICEREIFGWWWALNLHAAD